MKILTPTRRAKAAAARLPTRSLSEGGRGAADALENGRSIRPDSNPP